jgi:hypothetical protein
VRPNLACANPYPATTSPVAHRSAAPRLLMLSAKQSGPVQAPCSKGKNPGLPNKQRPQSVLQSRTHSQAMKDWHKLKLELFKKTPTTLRDVTSRICSKGRYRQAIL